ncbi:MAG: response regulator [Acidobacteria bacterium]|nr:response regulator [Deltaproteobacteria bacterium]MBA3948702.1 response regulator [Acidobacteriota bacterium]
MIVDDDVGMRETIGRHLRVSGFDVVSVATGVEGIRTAQGTSIDIGLIDYHLPDMDGIDCVRTLLEERRNQSLRLLLFTADWSVEERGSELRQLGVTVLSKLCDLHDIEAALRRTMAS